MIHISSGLKFQGDLESVVRILKSCLCGLPKSYFQWLLLLASDQSLAPTEGSVVLTLPGPATDGSIGVWETQPIWDNLATCLTWLMAVHPPGLSGAYYHRTTFLQLHTITFLLLS